jgi:hypothetical protein
MAVSRAQIIGVIDVAVIGGVRPIIIRIRRGP